MLEKTNVMRIIEQKKLPYVSHYYGDTDAVSGVDVAAAMGEDPEKVFKTLVCTGKTGNHYVFVIPVKEELDLKKAAKAVGEKSMEMLKSKDLLPLTGYSRRLFPDRHEEILHHHRALHRRISADLLFQRRKDRLAGRNVA